MICGLSRVLQHRARPWNRMKRLGSTFQYSRVLWKAEPKAVHLLLLLWVLSQGSRKSRPYSLEAAYATRGGSNILDYIYIGKKLLLPILAAGGCIRLCV